MEFCSECGIQNEATANVCKNCGASLSLAPVKGFTSTSTPASSNFSNQPATTLTCSLCSSSNPEGTKFCGNCGSEMAQQPSATTSSIYCGECGAENSSSSTYCGSCGKVISAPKGSNPGIQSSPSSNNQPEATMNYQQPTSRSGYSQTGYQARPQQGYNPNPMQQYRQSEKSVALAVLVSFILPGFGSLYVGKAGRGIGIFFAVILLSSVGIGIFIWIWQIFDASNQVKEYNRGIRY